MSKDGDQFGTGVLEGVVAPETAAHAAGTSALLPMITLGIPGSPTAAVLLGGLLIWGLQPGPLLFAEKPDFVWGLIASMYLGNVAGLIVVLSLVPLFAGILRIPFSIIAPVIVAICAIGAFTVNNAMQDIWFMLGFGVIGYLFKKLRLSAGADGAGAGARQQRRKRVSPGHAYVAGRHDDHVVELAGRQHHHARGGHAVLAPDIQDPQEHYSSQAGQALRTATGRIAGRLRASRLRRALGSAPGVTDGSHESGRSRSTRAAAYFAGRREAAHSARLDRAPATAYPCPASP